MTKHDPTEIERHEHTTWESSAEIYADAIGFMTAQSGQPEIVINAGEIDRQSHVLDVGCGPGLLSGALVGVAERVEGVDFSEKMVAAAREAYPDLTFQVANAEALPFEAASFDVAVCNYTAHHFARPETVFSELLRVLKPGGRVVVVHPIQAEQASFGSFAESLYESLPPEQIPSGPLLDVAEPKEYLDLLTGCGYVSVACKKRQKPVELEDINQLLSAGWKIGGLADQPQDIQHKIRESTIARSEQYKNADGSYSFPDVVLVVIGRKPN